MLGHSSIAAQMERWQRRSSRKAIAAACAGALLPTAAGAQDDTESRGTIRVEVTGSNIRRIEGESGLPLQVTTREELVRGGVQTAQELLDRISANQSFGGYAEALGIGTTVVGFTAASLRGLGAQRTLVLLNGRRLSPYALSGGQSVDLSGIPASALDRVEILKDGASAVYGTDAIGGVINFVLRKDFQGVEVNANYFVTEQGGGDNRRINATAGYGDLARDAFNFFVSTDYFKQEPLKASQRDFSRTAYIPSLGLDRTSGNSLPANISQPGGFGGVRNPTIPPSGATPGSCLPPFSFPTQASRLQCRFDYASVIETIPEAEKTNVIGRLAWQIDAQNQLFAEATHYRGKFIQRASPTPVSGDAMLLPPSSPYYPGAYVASLPGGDASLPVQVGYRTVELGPRTDEGTVDQWTFVGGLQGTINGWDYQIAANWVRNRQQDDYTSGWISASRFGQLLRSGVIDPFGYNSEAVVEQMRATQILGRANDNTASNYGGDVKVSGSLYELPAGPLALGLGLEGRRESLEQTNADFVSAGDVLGGAGAVPSLPEFHRTVWALFGELNIPLARSFEANVALRHDRYSDFGGTTNPKLTLRWQPNRRVLLRAAYGTGFRAPTLSDLFQPLQFDFEFNAFNDPIRCPVTQSEADCEAFFPTRTGGNPLLQPEKSRQWNAGFVVEPVSGVSASIDYYWVEVSNAIFFLDGQTIFGNYALVAPAHVFRKPPDARYPDLPGEIDYLLETSINVGKLQTSGIDVDLRFRAPPTPIGQFAAALTGTYVIDYKLSGINSVLFPASVGARGPAGAVSRWRHYATLDWNRGAWGATLAQTFQNGYREPDLTSSDPRATRRVGSYSVWDLQGRYGGLRNLTLTLGVRNLFDTAPPTSNQGVNFQIGYDPTYGDSRGRTYYAAVRYAFK